MAEDTKRSDAAAAAKQSGPSGRKPPAYVTFTNQLKPEFWPGWDTGLILSGDLQAIGAEAIRRCEAAGSEVTGFWIVKHDRDTLADGARKDDHIHAVLQQGGPGQHVAGKLQCVELDQALGWSKSIVRAPGRGGRIENALSYLIHAKDPDKFQYAVSDVATLRGLDSAEVEKANRRAWARRAVMAHQVAIPAKEWAELGDIVVQRVLDDELDELEILADKTLTDIYTRNQAKVDLAFSVRNRRDMLAEVRKLRAGEFQKTVVWFTGASDQGKTWAAESVAQELAARLGWSVFRATARNGPDDYAGQQVFLMNEPSTRVMEWADLLTLLGPREAGPISARYRNKGDAAPRVVLVAVSVDPVEFGFFVPGKRSTTDSLDQLVRRLSLLAHAEKVDGVPRYSVGPLALLPAPEQRRIAVPNRPSEAVAVSYGLDDAATLVDLTHDEVVGVVVAEVAERSPDVQLVVAQGSTRAELVASGTPTRAALAAAPEPAPTAAKFNLQPQTYSG